MKSCPNHTRQRVSAFAILLIFSAGPVMAQQAVVDFSPAHPIEAIEARDATPELMTDAKGRTWLKLATGTQQRWPGITLRAPEEGWDFSGHRRLEMDIRNLDDHPVDVFLRIDSATNNGRELTKRITVAPHTTTNLYTPIQRRLPELLQEKFFGMRGFPAGYRKDGLVDPSRISRLLVFVASPKRKHLFAIDSIRLCDPHADTTRLKPTDEGFFPMIDRYGQYMHSDWPGKTHSDEDLEKRRTLEAADLARHPVPGDRNRWGGWKSGPKLGATGHFRTAKHRGRWWLVDPDGHLFWSHGIDCVRIGNATTPLDDREHWFAGLPSDDSPFARFYGTATWAPHGYYKGRGRYRTYCFDAANLLRKHGEDYEQEHADLTHRRIRSWGMNTIANWSDAKIYLMHRTPYTATLGFYSKPIEASEGYWKKFPDPFDPDFRKGIQRAAAGQAKETANDPWCIGYFVHNELPWKSDTSLARSTLASPAEQPAKKAMVRWLNRKHETVERLNGAWGTDYPSWDAVLETGKVPGDTPALVADLKAFYAVLANEYFRIIREELKAVAPDKLYLGCRFSNDNETAVRAAGKHCEVISFNRYRYSVADLSLPQSVDRPVLIGEFHFGALDRGMFHTGLRATANQRARAKAYADYVTGALKNPHIVGTHWFQYRDQATTGRGDGENYQIGFVDCCDTPYPEIINASRRVGQGMYRIRNGNQ